MLAWSYAFVFTLMALAEFCEGILRGSWWQAAFGVLVAVVAVLGWVNVAYKRRRRARRSG